MELADYLRIFRRHWLSILVAVFAGLAVALVYTLFQPKVYAADATGFVSVTGSDSAALASVGDSLAKSRATSYVAVATSRPVAEDVIAELRLADSPANLAHRISVSQPLNTVLLTITARASTPLAAQQLADAWVEGLSSEVAKIENPTNIPNAQVPSVQVLAQAGLPTTPASPNLALDLALGLLAGLVVGIAYTVLRTTLDRRLRDSAAIEHDFQTSVIGKIPDVATLAISGDQVFSFAIEEGAIGTSYANSQRDEAFRKLRTNLAYMSIDDPPKIIVVTSASQGEGKSTVSANLAAAIAASGQRVLLIDADLRRPKIAKVTGIVDGAGLTDVLTGRAGIDDVTQEHAEIPHLRIMAAGAIPPNPSELLASKTMRILLAELARDQMIVLDAPPLLPVTDAAILSVACDGAIVVTSYGRTLDTDLGTALGNLRSVNGKILGIVFNRVPRKLLPGRYYGIENQAARGRTPVPPRAVQPEVEPGREHSGRRALHRVP